MEPQDTYFKQSKKEMIEEISQSVILGEFQKRINELVSDVQRDYDRISKKKEKNSLVSFFNDNNYFISEAKKILDKSIELTQLRKEVYGSNLNTREVNYVNEYFQLRQMCKEYLRNRNIRI